MRSMGAAARAASRLIARADSAAKNSALAAMAAEIRKQSEKILAANAADVAGAKQGGRDAAFLDRLMLGAKAVEQMAAGNCIAARDTDSDREVLANAGVDQLGWQKHIGVQPQIGERGVDERLGELARSEVDQ